ncbi:hypothetical protein FQN60_018470 [Etheostoma spectabile]|uniref:Transmembrane protein 252 n=1 Tax=Etheostoma spectabile TaxID=54343 RepID=A0A5J5DI29_9PERO|nr:hypothetical protein FQN60_018470 [Etheostoma spectabile]
MNVKKQLWSLGRIVLPGVGFGMTCAGSYLVSLQIKYEYSTRVIPAYIMVVFGILAVFVGVFWTVCHSMKKNMYQGGGHGDNTQVYTIERPSSFPPPYEESHGSPGRPETASGSVVVVDGLNVTTSFAPPLYSQDSSDAPDCTWSWEQPPPYSRISTISSVII